MSDLLLLISALVASLGTVDATVTDRTLDIPGVPVAFGLARGNRETGRCSIQISTFQWRAPVRNPSLPERIAHELTHCVDFADNVAMDGSLLPHACVTRPGHDCAHMLVDLWLADPQAGIRALEARR